MQTGGPVSFSDLVIRRVALGNSPFKSIIAVWKIDI